MKRMKIVSGLFLLLAPMWTFGQASQATPAFEVAAIKPAPPLNLNRAAIAAGQLPHVGINVQGLRVDIGYLSLADLITVAFKVKPSQISGPEWMKADRFDILAKMPDGARSARQRSRRPESYFRLIFWCATASDGDLSVSLWRLIRSLP